jgi:hypothetical protein
MGITNGELVILYNIHCDIKTSELKGSDCASLGIINCSPCNPFTIQSEMNPKGNQENQNLRRLRVTATTPDSRLIENRESRFPRAVAMAIDDAQEVMNDLYREEAEYGDGSCAFMVMKEQFEGGVENPPMSLKKGTLHKPKCRQYISHFKKRLLDLPSEPNEPKEKIAREIKKMEEALQWAEDYRNGNDPVIPRWANSWKDQLGK